MKTEGAMRFFMVLSGLALAAAAAVPCTAEDLKATVVPAATPQDYQTKIKPLLRDRCYSCHGGLKQKAGLRVDSVDLMLRGGDSGPAIVKGNADESPLVERVAAEDVSDRMPPEHVGSPLTAEQVALLRGWIAAGAPGPADEQPETDSSDHWAFRPIVRPAVPHVGNAGWVRNPIDAFVAKKHDVIGLTPNREASRPELLRRLSIDLIGLPPTPEEINAFLGDREPGWYDRVVERLLTDPRHGERWARHWMDVWRYSDWWGLGDQIRNSNPHIWHWRDWIVESLNADAPYDEMVRLMLAADEIRPDDLGALRATGYLVRNYFLFNRNQWMDETVEHVAKGFLGLTMNCAKCHDHMYDPLSQVEYYRMRAIFEPYHVRVDVRPGEADLSRDGIPRAFDGLLDVPTYRFIRGEEARPDRSAPLAPGVPSAIAFAPLKVEAVELPPEASHPERRAWVAAAYREAARVRYAGAEAKLRALEKNPNPSPAGSAEADLELRLARASLAAAEAERRSLERRIEAAEATWNQSQSEGDSSVEKEHEANRRAARSEREWAVEKARVALATAELRLYRAAADKKAEEEKGVASAREALEKASKEVEGSSESYTRLAGAQWSPTRFLDSTKDDPAVAFPARSSGRRKALAEWITDRRNPLTARVAVNHVWTRHMGTPLVSTVFDFGRKGSPPTNPELLDWLAAEFIDSGWSMKRLHRLIVGSATYRLSSSRDSRESIAKDPENIGLWRRTPIRIESQVVRDSMLALAGKLDATMGGPSTPTSVQADSTRRSLYFFHSNNERNPFLTVFDEALVKECYRREQSIVPQQALALTNSRMVLDSARPIAERLTRSLDGQGAAADDLAFARSAFVVLLGVEPDEAEQAAMTQALDEWKTMPEASGDGDAALWARSQLVGVLLNHNDFVTLR